MKTYSIGSMVQIMLPANFFKFWGLKIANTALVLDFWFEVFW